MLLLPFPLLRMRAPPHLWPARACSHGSVHRPPPRACSHGSVHRPCFNGFEGAVSAPCGRVANAPFFGLPELGFRWCLAVSDPLPTSFIFAFVQAWLRHGFCPPICPPTAVLYLSVLTVSKVQFQQRVEGLRTHRFLPCLSSDLGGVWLFRIRCRRASFLPLSRLGCVTVFAHLFAHCGPLPVCFNGFEGAVSAPCGRVASAPFFALPELGFRWCLAVSDPLPTSFIFAFVQAWLRHLLRSFTCLF